MGSSQSDEGGKLRKKIGNSGYIQAHPGYCGLTLTGAIRKGFLEEVVSELRNKGLAVKRRQKMRLRSWDEQRFQANRPGLLREADGKSKMQHSSKGV